MALDVVAEASRLRELQLEKLRRQVAHLARRSPFYEDKLRAAGVDADTLRSLDDLGRFPFTTKRDPRVAGRSAAARHACLRAAGAEDVVRLHASTGTTGAPSWVGVTANDAEMWARLTAESFRAQGISREDVVVHAAGLTMFVGGLPVQAAIERLGATFVPIGTGASEKVMQAMRTLGRTVLHSTPSYALYLAEYAHRQDVEPRSLGVRKLVVGGEPGGGQPAVRERIESEWGAPVTEGLGNADMAPVIWGECEHGQGMHLTGAEWVHAELIEPPTRRSDCRGSPGSRASFAVHGAGAGVLRAPPLPYARPLTRARGRLPVWPRGRAGPLYRPHRRHADRPRCQRVPHGDPRPRRRAPSPYDRGDAGRPRAVGARVDPPLLVEAEHGLDAGDLGVLKAELEARIRARLTIAAEVRLVPPETIARSEMKTALTRVEVAV